MDGSERSGADFERAKRCSSVAEEWLEHKKLNIRANTWEMYQSLVRNHFVDLNHVKINMINITTIEKWIASRQAETMALGTLRNILVTVNQIMAYALRHRLIDGNPVRDAERPRMTIDDRSSEIIVFEPRTDQGID